MERRRVATHVADALGCSRLMETDAAGTRTAPKAHRKQRIEPNTAEYHGCVVEVTADSMSMQLRRVVDALVITVESLSFSTRTDWGAAEPERAA